MPLWLQFLLAGVGLVIIGVVAYVVAVVKLLTKNR